MEKRQYAYEGAVLEFDRVVANYWQAYTWATSPEKARANLTYRFKKETGREAMTKIVLPGRLMEVA